MNMDGLLKGLETLPPLSDTVFLIQQVYAHGSENVNILDLVKVIESDVSLTINILKMVNAPIYGLSREISSISQAVTLLGTQRIYGLVLNFCINQKVKANTRIFGVTNVEFNEICHLQSSLMLEWCSTIDETTAKLLAPLALIMESGKLVLANELVKNSFAKEYRERFLACENMQECEHELIGTTSYYLSGALFEYWNLDPIYVDILKGLDFEGTYSPKVEMYIGILDIVRVTVNLKNILTKESIYEAAGYVKELKLDDKEFIRIATKLREQYDKTKA